MLHFMIDPYKIYQHLKIACWFSLFLLCPATYAFANEEMPHTIRNLQLLGLQANGLIQAAQSQVHMAESGVVSAEAYPNPTVSVTAGTDSLRMPVQITGPVSTQRTVAVTQTIENPYLRSARISSAKANVDASQASFGQARADLAAEIRTRAYKLLMRQEIALMETDISGIMLQVREDIRTSVEVGETARYVLIRAETEALRSINRKETALLTAKQARVALIRLSAGALSPDFIIQASLNDPINLPPFEDLRQEIMRNNPDIQRLEAELKQAQSQIDHERAAIIPSVDLSYSNYRYRQYTSNVAGLSVSIPLFYRRKGEISRAKSDVRRINDTLAYRRFEIGQVLESVWQTKKIAERRVDMLQHGIVSEAKLALSVAQTAYRMGESGFIEVLDTKRVLRDAREELFQAQFELQSAVAEIDRLRAKYPKE